MATKKKQKTKTKPKKTQAKKSNEKFFVLDRGSTDWEECDTLDEAINFITADCLANYHPDDGIPDEDDIIIIKGERIPFRYESEIRAVKIHQAPASKPLPLPTVRH